MSENTDNRTATQRIEDLEKVVASMYQATGKLILSVEDLMKKSEEANLVKEALKLLNRKTEAIVQAAAPESGISDASVSSILIKLNVSDLIVQTAGYVAAGHLKATDAVTADSFLACEEINSEGTVVNPRIQFRLDSQPKETQDSLAGKKAGDLVSFGEKKFSVKILEVYTLQNPPVPPTQEAPQAAATTEAAAPSADTAPAAEAAPETTETAPSTPEAAAPAADVAATAPADSTTQATA